MALNIRNPETEPLASELPKLVGDTKTEAVDELEEIAEHCANLPVLDSRTPDEILGYDPHGLPH